MWIHDLVQAMAPKWMEPIRPASVRATATAKRYTATVLPSESAWKPRDSRKPLSAGSEKYSTKAAQPNQNDRGSCWATRHASRQTGGSEAGRDSITAVTP